jgi:hypothetical protein
MSGPVGHDPAGIWRFLRSSSSRLVRAHPPPIGTPRGYAARCRVGTRGKGSGPRISLRCRPACTRTAAVCAWWSSRPGASSPAQGAGSCASPSPRHNRGLGSYLLVHLDQARDAAADIRRAAREGRDLITERRGVQTRSVTFGKAQIPLRERPFGVFTWPWSKGAMTRVGYCGVKRPQGDQSAPAARSFARFFIEETLPDPGVGRLMGWAARAGSPT